MNVSFNQFIMDMECVNKYLGLLIMLVICNITAINAQMLVNVKPCMGIGRLQVSLNCDIPLYHNAKSLETFDTLRFSVVQSGNEKGKFEITTTFPIDMQAFSFYEGDSDIESDGNIGSGLVYFAPELSFRVISQTETGYQVVINEKEFETVFIKNDTKHKPYTEGVMYWNMSHRSEHGGEVWFLYETWETYLKRMMYVELNDKYIYSAINGSKSKIGSNTLFNVIKLEGNWAKVEERSSKKPPQTGWVQWTDGKGFLINPVAEIYY